MTIPAKYENGVFRPLEDVQITEGTRVEVYVPNRKPDQPTGKRRSVKEFAAYGIWKDREDMKDSVEYVNKIRQERY